MLPMFESLVSALDSNAGSSGCCASACSYLTNFTATATLDVITLSFRKGISKSTQRRAWLHVSLEPYTVIAVSYVQFIVPGAD